VRVQVGRSLTEAQHLLVDGDGCADRWVELSARLQRECLQLGAATYCLCEWVEPDDAHADIDEAHRQLRKPNRAGTIISRGCV
jgi:hypothetical protein